MNRHTRSSSLSHRFLVIERDLFEPHELSDFAWHLLEHELCRRLSAGKFGLDIVLAFTAHSHICILLPSHTTLPEINECLWHSGSWNVLEYQETAQGPRGRIIEECERHEQNRLHVLKSTTSANPGFWSIPNESLTPMTSSLLVAPIVITDHIHTVDETPMSVSYCDVQLTHYRVSEHMALLELKITKINEALVPMALG